MKWVLFLHYIEEKTEAQKEHMNCLRFETSLAALGCGLISFLHNTMLFLKHFYFVLICELEIIGTINWLDPYEHRELQIWDKSTDNSFS